MAATACEVIRMNDGDAEAGSGLHSRHERRVRHLREHGSDLPSACGKPRIQVGHRIFLHVNGEPIIGPGTHELLVRVEVMGSLHKAAQSMGMAYSKAWRVVQEAEGLLGVRLMNRRIGGTAGGGSVLTEDGRELVTRFRALREEADVELERLRQKYFGDAPFGPDEHRAASSGDSSR